MMRDPAMARLRNALNALQPVCENGAIQTASKAMRSTEVSAETITQFWLSAFEGRAGCELAFLYVANDVIQKTRKDGNFTFEFGKVMAQSIALAAKRNHRLAPKLKRLCSIWLQRAIFPKTFVRKLEATIGKYKNRNGGGASPRKRRRQESAAPLATTPRPKPKSADNLHAPPRQQSPPSFDLLPQAVSMSMDFVEEFGGQLPALLRDLSTARASIEGGQKILDGLEPIIAEGRLPAEAVERLSELTGPEYDGLMGQIADAHNALKDICAQSTGAADLRPQTLDAIASLLVEQEVSIDDTRQKIEQQAALVERLHAIQLAHGGKDIVARQKVLKEESLPALLFRRTSADEGLALEPLELESGGIVANSKAVADAALALEPAAEQNALRVKGEGENMEGSVTHDAEKNAIAEAESSKSMVWDALRREYVQKRNDDDDEDWRN